MIFAQKSYLRLHNAGSIVEKEKRAFGRASLITNSHQARFNVVNRKILQTAGICNCLRWVVTRTRKSFVRDFDQNKAVSDKRVSFTVRDPLSVANLEAE